jgi:hypothetical protein
MLRSLWLVALLAVGGLSSLRSTVNHALIEQVLERQGRVDCGCTGGPAAGSCAVLNVGSYYK